jgi:hypothetical protein
MGVVLIILIISFYTEKTFIQNLTIPMVVSSQIPFAGSLVCFCCGRLTARLNFREIIPSVLLGSFAGSRRISGL